MVRLWGNRPYHALLGKVQLRTTLMEGNSVISTRTINAFIFRPSNFSSGYLPFYVYLHMYKMTYVQGYSSQSCLEKHILETP